MKLRNPFSNETRELFRDAQYTCWICRGNGGGKTELNHIVGRDSASPLNASVLCTECHSHVGHTVEEHVNLLCKTLLYLMQQDYKLTERDHAFIRRHHLLFDKILES